MFGENTKVNIDNLFSEDKSGYNYLFNRDQYYIREKLSYKALKNGIIFPHKRDPEYNCGVWNADKTEFDKFTGTGSVINDEARFPADAQVVKSDQKVILIGAFAGIYGHFITDSFRYLWFLKSEYYEKYKDYKLVYYRWANFKMVGNYKRLLEIYGINTEELTEITVPTQFAEVIVPDPSFSDRPEIPTKCFAKEYLDTIEYIKSAVKSNTELAKIYNDPSNQKIYLSFSKFKNRTSIGEKKIEKFFKQNGFKVVYPEKHTIDEQIAMMLNCKTLASTDGSLLHNSMFMGDNTTLIIIPRGSYTTSYQDALNYLHDFDCYYIDSSLSCLVSKTGKAFGPFYFYVSEEMYKFFSVPLPKNYLKANFKDVKQYIKHGIEDADYTNFDTDGAYGKKFLHYNQKIIEKSEKLKEIFGLK